MSHDLRRLALRISDLRRKHEARIPLTSEEQEELQRGIPATEYRQIIESIRGERRSAAPSKAAKAAKAAPVTIDLRAYVGKEE